MRFCSPRIVACAWLCGWITFAHSADPPDAADLPAGAVRQYGDPRFHTAAPIQQIGMSGALVACESLDEVYLWTYPQGRLAKRWPGKHLPELRCFSSDGKRIVLLAPKPGVTGRFSRPPLIATVIDIENDKELMTVAAEQAAVTSVAWVPGGATLAVGYNSGRVELFNTDTGEGVGKLEYVQHLPAPAESPQRNSPKDGVVGGAKDRAKDDSRGATHSAPSRLGAVERIMISPDGKIAIIQYIARGPLCVWDLTNRKLRHLGSQRFGTDCVAAVIAPDNKTLRLAFHGRSVADSLIESFDVGLGSDLEQALKFRANHTGVALRYSAAFAADGRTYAQAAYWSSGLTWNEWGAVIYLEDVETRQAPAVGPMRGLPALAFSPDSKVLVTGDVNNMLRFWAADNGDEINPSQSHRGPVRAIAISPDERMIATGSDDNTVQLRDIATGWLVHVLEDDMNSVIGLVFLPDGQTLVSLSRDVSKPRTSDYTLRTWNVADGKKTAALAVPRGTGPLAVTRDGRYVAYTHGATIEVIDPAAPAIVEHPWGGYVNELQQQLHFRVSEWQGYANLITTTGYPSLTEKSVRGAQARQMKWHCAAISPDGSSMVTGHRHVLSVLDAATGQELRRITPVAEPAPARYVPQFWRVAFTPDGRRIISVQDAQPYTLQNGQSRGAVSYGEPYGDQEVHVWDASTGERLMTLRGHVGPIYDLAFAEQGRALFTAGADGTVLLWDLAQVPPPPPLPSDAAGLARLMTGPDNASALRAMQALVADPATAEKVIQIWWEAAPDDSNVSKQIAQLAQDDLVTRLEAIQTLAAMRESTPAAEGLLLRALLATDSSEHTRLCAAALLDAYYEPTTPAFVHLQRVIKLSEWLGDDSSMKRLALYANRLPTDRGGKAARTALRHIAANTHRQEYDALPPLAGPSERPVPAPMRILAPTGESER